MFVDALRINLCRGKKEEELGGGRSWVANTFLGNSEVELALQNCPQLLQGQPFVLLSRPVISREHESGQLTSLQMRAVHKEG